MTGLDAATFAEAMHALGETFNEPVSPIRTEAYFDALSDLSIEQVNAAVRLALRSCKFFPKPVELRELIGGAPDANADAAWGEVQREIGRVGYLGTPKFSDPRTALTVREVWGGWRRLCETLPAEGPELVGWVKQFKSTWQSQDRRDVEKRLEAGTLHPQIAAFIQGEQKRLKGPGAKVMPFAAKETA